MPKVKFGDVVNDVKVNIDRKNNPYEFYLAGEHMDSEDLHINRRGRFATDDVGPAFTRLFKPGQVLYGSRRTYLKKVAVADFEGICANTTFVFETKDNNKFNQRLLPFIMLSDSFTKYSVSKSKGSTNPYVLFSDLAEYEFNLPDTDKQEELAELLWTAQKTKQLYKQLLYNSNRLLWANFNKMTSQNVCTQHKLGELACKWMKGQPFKKTETDVRGENGCIHYGELFTTYGPIINEVKSKTNSAIKCSSKIGDILFPASDVTPNGLGRCSAIFLDDILLGGDIIIMRPKTSDINIKYLSYAINAQKNQLLQRITGSLVRHICAKSLQSVVIPVPSLEIQNKFVDFAIKLENAKLSLEPNIKNIDVTIKYIINQSLAGED